jgi:hypothetical protein
MSARTLLAVSLVLYLSVAAYGQYGQSRRRPQGGQQQPAEVNADGNVEAVGPGQIKMTNKSNQPMMVMVVAATKVHVTGSANPDYIRSGLYVEFTAEVSKEKTVSKKIEHLTVFSPTAEKGIGLSSQGGGGADAFSPAPDVGTKGKAHGTAHKPSPAVQLPAVCTVRGVVKSCKAGTLTVSYGHGAVKAEIADNVEISVDVADLSAASKGDSITVKGRNVPGRTGQVLAETVDIKATKPLSGSKKKGSRPERPTPKATAHTKKTPSGDAPDKPDAAAKPD